MFSRFCKCLLMIGMALLVTGCWSKRELNELAIAVALGLDAAESGKYLVSVQLVNPEQIASKDTGGRNTVPVSTFREEADSIGEALRRMTVKLDHQVYLSHLRMVIIGEALARRGIAKPLDFLSRDHEVRSDFYIVVARQTKAADLLDVLTPREKIPANQMNDSLTVSEKSWAATSKMTLDNVMNDMESVEKNVVLTGLSLIGSTDEGMTLENLQSSESPARFQYNGLAVFKHDKMIGWLNEDESKGYHYTQGDVKSTFVVSECRGGKVSVELIRTKTIFKTMLTRRKLPEIRIDIYAEGNVGEVGCTMNMLDSAAIEQIEHITAQNIEDQIISAVRKAQSRFGSDIFGFAETAHRDYPKHWRKWERNWESIFKELTVHPVVKVDIRRSGRTNQSILSRVRR